MEQRIWELRLQKDLSVYSGIEGASETLLRLGLSPESRPRGVDQPISLPRNNRKKSLRAALTNVPVATVRPRLPGPQLSSQHLPSERNLGQPRGLGATREEAFHPFGCIYGFSAHGASGPFPVTPAQLDCIKGPCPRSPMTENTGRFVLETVREVWGQQE